MFFWFSLDYYVLVLLAFAVLGLVSFSVLRQEIGWEECHHDLFCIEWDVKS